MDSSKFIEVSLSKVTLYTDFTIEAQRQGMGGGEIDISTPLWIRRACTTSET